MFSFNYFHTGVVFLYLLFVIGFCFLAFHPIYLLCNILAGYALSCVLCGIKSAAKMLIWQLPLFLITAVLNPIFSQYGTTLLMSLGAYHLYLESLLYGLCMGCMLISVIIWFSNGSHMLDTDKLLNIFGNILPTITLMVSMVLKSVPELVRKGKCIHETLSVNLPFGAQAKFNVQTKLNAQKKLNAQTNTASNKTRARAKQGMREITTLMANSMEESLQTADSMRSRGWGCSKKRASYLLQKWHKRDTLALIIICALAALNAFFAYNVCTHFSFYPQLGALNMHWSYISYLVFLVLPFIVYAFLRTKV